MGSQTYALIFEYRHPHHMHSAARQAELAPLHAASSTECMHVWTKLCSRHLLPSAVRVLFGMHVLLLLFTEAKHHCCHLDLLCC
jgi:hypothetical protein